MNFETNIKIKCEEGVLKIEVLTNNFHDCYDENDIIITLNDKPLNWEEAIKILETSKTCIRTTEVVDQSGKTRDVEPYEVKHINFLRDAFLEKLKEISIPEYKKVWRNKDKHEMVKIDPVKESKEFLECYDEFVKEDHLPGYLILATKILNQARNFGSTQEFQYAEEKLKELRKISNDVIRNLQDLSFMLTGED